MVMSWINSVNLVFFTTLVCLRYFIILPMEGTFLIIWEPVLQHDAFVSLSVLKFLLLYGVNFYTNLFTLSFFSFYNLYAIAFTLHHYFDFNRRNYFFLLLSYACHILCSFSIWHRTSQSRPIYIWVRWSLTLYSNIAF